MKTHQSKIDKIYWVILLFFVVMAVYGIIIQEWLMAIISTISSAYFCLIFFTMRYVIDDEYLLIRTKFFPSQKVALQNIRKIEESNSILAAPAFSFDRLEIFYTKYDSILVSPENKEQFIADLLNVNPEIEIKYKKKI